MDILFLMKDYNNCHIWARVTGATQIPKLFLFNTDLYFTEKDKRISKQRTATNQIIQLCLKRSTDSLR